MDTHAQTASAAVTDALRSLDELGILEGTNKSSLLVDYLRHYDRLFARFRHEAITLIEIGIDQGASLRMWPRYFTKATIVGIDVQPDKTKHASDRVIVEIGSQANLGFITGLCKRYDPTIIVDDGSHQARDVLYTFQTMFPFVRPGGIYVMEDLYLHFGHNAKGYAATATTLPSDYIFRLGNNLVSNAMDPAENYGLEQYLFNQIDTIEVIRNSLVITKKATPVAGEAERWMDLVRRSGQDVNWRLLSGRLQRASAAPDLIAEALAHCIRMAPGNHQHYYDLSFALEAMGNIEGAISAAKEAAGRAEGEQGRIASQRRAEALSRKG